MRIKVDESFKKAKPVIRARSFALIAMIVVPLIIIFILLIIWYIRKNRK